MLWGVDYNLPQVTKVINTTIYILCACHDYTIVYSLYVYMYNHASEVT